MTDNRMTSAERTELKALVNERGRLAVSQVRALAAQRVVELNRQLEAAWKAEDFQLGELLHELQQKAEGSKRRHRGPLP